MKKPAETDELTISARAPFHVYYEGKARSISAINKVGQFDVLPGHADFFSVLSPGEVTIETATEPVVFEASNGIITVRNNNVMLFVNI